MYEIDIVGKDKSWITIYVKTKREMEKLRGKSNDIRIRKISKKDLNPNAIKITI